MKTQAQALLERRLLGALEQAVSAALPADWKNLKLSPDGRRPAAAVLLRLAEADTRNQMLERLVGISEKADEKRRKSGKSEREPLWHEVSRALRDLGSVSDAPGLLALELWRRVPGVPLDNIYESLQPFLPAQIPVGEPILTQASRILLRARARRWMEEAAEAEREAG